MERFHKTLKYECVRPLALVSFEENQSVLEAYVHEYNHERLHSALNGLTPSGDIKGEDHIKHRLELRKTNLEQAREVRCQKANPASSGSQVSQIGANQNSAIFVDIAQDN